MHSVKDHTLITTLSTCWAVLSCQNDIWLSGSFVYFYWPDHGPDALPGVNF